MTGSSLDGLLDRRSYPEDISREALYMIRQVKELAALTAHLEADVSNLKRDLLLAQENMANEHRIHVASVENALKVEIRNLEAQKDDQIRNTALAKDDEIWQLRAQYEAMISQLEGVRKILEASMKAMAKEHAKELDQTKEETGRQFDDTIRTLHDKIARLEADTGSVEMRHKAEIDGIHQSNRNEINRLTWQHKEKIRAKEAEFAEERSRYDQRRQRAIDDHNQDLRRLDSEHREAQRLLALEHEKETDRLNALLAQFQHNSDAEKVKLSEIFEERLQLAEREKKAEMAQKELLKVALVKREHFKAMPDHQLSARFQDLASDVDEVARVRWDASKGNEWPWPDDILRKSENERKLKHDIMKSQIWAILYQYIFCTPFRVLGDHGKFLERQWAEASGHRMNARLLLRAY